MQQMTTIPATPDAIEAAWLAGKPTAVASAYTKAEHTLLHMVACELCDHPSTELSAMVALLRRLALAGDPEAMRIIRRMSHQIARSCGSDCDVPAKSEKHPNVQRKGYETATLMLGKAEVEVRFNGTEGEAAQTSGPPERCYEGTHAEVELQDVRINGVWVPATPDFFAEDVLDAWVETLLTEDEDDYFPEAA